MSYYAPFYRPTYYDPVQQNPMGQFNQQFHPPQQVTFPTNCCGGVNYASYNNGCGCGC